MGADACIRRVGFGRHSQNPQSRRNQRQGHRRGWRPRPGSRSPLFLRYKAGGKFHWTVQARDVHTDDRGEYRIADVWGEVAPAVRPTQWPITPTYSDGQNPLAAYPQTYYPGVTDLTLAIPVDVSSGSDIHGVDIRIRRVPSFRVAGRVFGLAGSAASGVNVVLSNDGDTDGTQISHNVRTAPDGSFVFASVMPGQYELKAVDSFGDTTSATTQQLILSTRKPDFLKLQLRPTLTIAGVLKIEGQKKLNAAGRQVSFRGRSAGGSDGVVKADGTFTIRNLQPSKGTFAINWDLRTYVKSMTYGGQNVADSEIDLRQGGAGQLEIVLSSDTASVSGVIVDADQKPVQGAWVAMVLGQDISNWDGGPEARPFADERGHFAMEGLPPGRHRLIAWSTVDGYTPASAEKYSDYVLDIDLQPNTAKEVVLKCIPADVLRETEARAGNPSQ